MKDGAYVVHLDTYKSIGTHWIAFYANGNSLTYFDSFGVEHFPKEIKKVIGNKNIKANIFRLQACDSIMRRQQLRIGIIDFMFRGTNLADFTNLFSPHKFKKNDEVIFNYFMK